MEIDAFVVRNGCSLTLYKAGTHEQKTFKAENEDLIEKDLEHSNEKSYSKYYYYNYYYHSYLPKQFNFRWRYCTSEMHM